ncbi:MAG: hypothetical protein JJT94_15555 [Bernardetiaceae bacterium]|nr:hypothetical protein [Bernardetiaceae bacterium]
MIQTICLQPSRRSSPVLEVLALPNLRRVAMGNSPPFQGGDKGAVIF